MQFGILIFSSKVMDFLPTLALIFSVKIPGILGRSQPALRKFQTLFSRSPAFPCWLL